MKKLKTSIAFAKNLFVTGAIMETSRTVEIEICQHIPTGKDVTVVEYGMGHGNITKEILSRVTPNSKVYAFEVKEEFCEHVKNNIKDERLHVICDGAENVKQYVKNPVHAVIASIPYSFFSKEKALGIIRNSYDILVPGGYYNQVLYTTHNFKKFKRVFDDCEMEKVTNRIPSEYIYFCRRRKKAK
jgi:phospholipid N-methyltransferase